MDPSNFLDKTDQESTKHKNKIVTEFGEDQATYILGMFTVNYVADFSFTHEKI